MSEQRPQESDAGPREQTGPDQPSAELNSGTRMPLFGLGTWQATGSQAYEATLRALQLGYRHIDTATMYRNEARVGRAIADSGIAREDIFLTTKLPPDRAGDEAATLAGSLSALGTDHLDLWLIHWPPLDGVGVSTWRAFVEAQQSGSVAAIGVSNYGVDQIDTLTDATGVTPAVNQVRWSPYLYDAAVAAAHVERGVVLEGYSPLKGGVLSDAVVTRLAKSYGRTPAQVVLRWHLDHGFVAIPKSADPSRLAENLDVFDWSLEQDALGELDELAGR